MFSKTIYNPMICPCYTICTDMVKNIITPFPFPSFYIIESYISSYIYMTAVTTSKTYSVFIFTIYVSSPLCLFLSLSIVEKNYCPQSDVSPFTFDMAWGKASIIKDRHSVAALGLPGRFMMILSPLIPHIPLDMIPCGVIL